jgi:hypothetical protein
MKNSLKFGLIASMFGCFVLEAFLIADDVPAMQRAPRNVQVDGKMTEWGDTLAMYDPKTKLNYTVANDDSNIYVCAFVADAPTKHKIMNAGITVSINSEGKKNKTYSLTYPLAEKPTLASAKSGYPDDEEQKPRSLLASTSIKVAGFKDVESDVITTSNTYGFKAALGFDDKHDLVYETAIPLKWLDIKPNKKKPTEFAVNITINGIERPDNGARQSKGGLEPGGIGGGGGMGGGGFGGGGMSGGGMGGGGRRGGGGRGGNMGGQQGQNKSSNSEPEDFWVKMVLAK